MRRLEGKGVGLLLLSMGGQPLDTASPTGRVVLTIMAAIAQFERELMKERQREGDGCQGEGGGTLPGPRADRPREGRGDRRPARAGVAGAEIARRLGIGVASVFRVLREGRGQPGAS